VLSFLVDVGVLAGIYGILAVSLHLQAGVAGLLDFGLIAFFGVGGYATGIGTMHGLPWPLAMLSGLAIAAVGGAAVGRLGRTLRADYWAMATLAMASLVALVALNSTSLTRGPRGIASIPGFFLSLGPLSYNYAWLGLVAAVLAGCMLVSHQVTNGQFGRVLRLVRETEDMAVSLGHDVVSAKVVVMAISAPMAALAGSLYSHYITFIGPTELQAFGTFLVFTMVVVGGLGSLGGVVVGAVVVELLYNGTRYLSDVGVSPSTAAGLRIVVIGAALLGFLYFRPAGLWPERLRRVRAPQAAPGAGGGDERPQAPDPVDASRIAPFG
jgi:branched-chain amino acid transport system permease protein